MHSFAQNNAGNNAGGNKNGGNKAAPPPPAPAPPAPPAFTFQTSEVCSDSMDFTLTGSNLTYANTGSPTASFFIFLTGAALQIGQPGSSPATLVSLNGCPVCEASIARIVSLSQS